jgi:hypothetical protein
MIQPMWEKVTFIILGLFEHFLFRHMETRKLSIPLFLKVRLLGIGHQDSVE